MKRFDATTNKEYEVLFTEAAYELHNDPKAEYKLMIRLKSNYKGYDKVYLIRLSTERNSDFLEYHNEGYFMRH